MKLLLLLTHLTAGTFIQSPRLRSSAGAGVATMLIDESTLFNPAPLSFFNYSSIYYQETRPKDAPLQDSMVIITDAKNVIKGSVAYKIGSDNHFRFSLAAPVGDKTGMGVTYILEDNSINIGMSHVVSPSLSTGILISNPTKENGASESLAIVGIQYVYQEFISIMGDIGTKYYEDFQDNFYFAIGGQFKLVGDFYLRLGFNKDDLSSTSGIGLSWLGPKLHLEFASNQIRINDEKETVISYASAITF